jgi:hypothetical protein
MARVCVQTDRPTYPFILLCPFVCLYGNVPTIHHLVAVGIRFPFIPLYRTLVFVDTFFCLPYLESHPEMDL